MIQKIIINEDEIRKRLMTNEFILEPLTILYGCNGSGKSTLLNEIKLHNSAKNSKIEILGDCRKVAYYDKNQEDANSIPNSHIRSVGENSIILMVGFLRTALRDPAIDVVLLDEFDKGLSVEHVNEMFGYIRTLVKRGKQVILSCTTYHPIFISRKFTNMITGEIEYCNSYEEFYGTAIEGREILTKQLLMKEGG